MKSGKRKPNWKNIGFAVSWVVFVVCMGFVCAEGIWTFITGTHISDNEPMTSVICMAGVAWYLYRNRGVSMNEYMERWRERRSR